VKVALLNNVFWPEVRRGSERLLHDLAVDLVALGHRPRLITSHKGPPTRSVEDGFAITRHWRPPRTPLRMRKIDPNITHLPFSYIDLRAGRDDVAHAFFPPDACAAARWTRRTGRPSVFSYMGIPQRNVISTPRLRLRLLEGATRHTTAVTVISKASQDAMWRWLGVRAHLIYPGINLDLFTPGGERDPEPTIACAGAVDDGRKRIPLLIEAFRLVRRERPTAKLLLLRPSDPGLERQLLDAADGLELYDADITGIADLFRRAWVSGLASYNEAFGLVVVESLATGTPVFGANDGGIPEIVDSPDIGRLFDGDAPEDVAAALLGALELAEDPKTAARCRARAEHFTTMRGARAYEALYADLLAA
jgi:glycosyltransferase involved in cell wall biosynthesis